MIIFSFSSPEMFWNWNIGTNEELKEGMEIQEAVVLKSNDQKHHGLTFGKGELGAAPTLYLDEAFERMGGSRMHLAIVRDRISPPAVLSM